MRSIDPSKELRPNQRAAFWPQTSLGRAALVLAVAALASLFVFPVLTLTLRNTFPVVDTWLMPAILAALIAVAALCSVVAVWRRRERSTVSIIVLALATVGTLVAVLIFVGSALTGS